MPEDAEVRGVAGGRDIAGQLGLAGMRGVAGVLGCGLLILAGVGMAMAGPELVAAATWAAERGRPVPEWLLGPFGSGLELTGGEFYALLWVAFAGYLAVIWAAPRLGRALIWRLSVALVLLFTLAPPLLSQDVFSYIAYARMGAEAGLNPYVGVPADLGAPAAGGDAVMAYVGWPDTVSAYGPLFTLGSYALAPLGLSASLWMLKALTSACLLGLVALVGRIAARRGLDPGQAIAIVALNPLTLAHVVGGAHNDAIMMLVAMGAVALLLAGDQLRGGALLVAAGAIKLSALFLAPYAAIAALRDSLPPVSDHTGAGGRRAWLGLPVVRLALGALLAALAIGIAAAIAFGAGAAESLSLIDRNQEATTRYSVPATLSRLLGVGVDPLRTVALVAFLIAAGLAAWRTWRGADWVRTAGWAGLAMLLATGWLLPWYLIWVLPLAAIARDRALVGCLLALTAFQLISRVPI